MNNNRTSVDSFLIRLIASLFAPLAAAVHADAGDFDNTFGSGGKVIVSPSAGNDTAYAIAVQGDGKILIGGSAGTQLALVRLNPDGALDASFGSGGTVLTSVGVSTYGIRALRVMADGRILAVGPTLVSSNKQFIMVRYNGNGTLDTSFNGTGFRLTPFAGAGEGTAGFIFQNDGRVLVAGDTNYGRFAVWRFTADGAVDTGFTADGLVNVDFGADDVVDEAAAIAVQPDNRIVAAGGDSTSGGFALARLNADGTLDAGFGTGGKLTTDFGAGPDRAFAVIVQPDGKIIAAGSTNNGSRFALARYRTNGSLDSSFGTGGKVTTAFTAGASVAALMLQPDGKILAVGRAGGDVVVARYNDAGQLDPSFGTGGKKVISYGPGSDAVHAALLQADGRFLLAGSARETTDDFAVSRHNTAMQLLSATGHISLLRAHDVGTGYGAAPDNIDVEVVVHLDSTPGRAYGFKVRNDGQRYARQAMFDLLRDAFNHNWNVTLNYNIDPGDTNGEIIRVWLTK